MLYLEIRYGRACFCRGKRVLFTMDGSTRDARREAGDMLDYLNGAA